MMTIAALSPVRCDRGLSSGYTPELSVRDYSR